MFFSQEDVPHSATGVIVWPVILFAVACVIAYFAHRVEWNGGKAPWKWAALIPLAFGLAIGVSALLLVTYTNYDILALAAGAGRKVAYALWGTFVLPVLGIAAFVGWQIWARKQNMRY